MLVVSRLLRACRDLADEAEMVCPAIARAVHKAVLEPVDAFLKAQGYITTVQHAEAAQRAFIAVQQRDAATARADALVDHLARAALRVIALESELTKARKSGGGDRLYARVGLHPSAPEFLLTGCRKLYRKAYHPDCRPEHEKAAAQREFQNYEAIFDGIYSQRRGK